jgi:hypothetical protein
MWPTLMIDVGLDIALFYSDKVTRSYSTDVVGSFLYSTMKADFAHREARTESGYYRPTVPDLPYLPLSVGCRIGERFDADTLADFWLDFRSRLTPYGGGGVPDGRVAGRQLDHAADVAAPVAVPERATDLSERTRTPRELAEQVRRHYAHPQQISLRRLEARIANLTPGRYVVVRAVRRLRSQADRKRMLFFMPRFRVGAVTILPEDRLRGLRHFAARGYVWVHAFGVS